jgi:hypothetical protein
MMAYLRSVKPDFQFQSAMICVLLLSKVILLEQLVLVLFL